MALVKPISLLRELSYTSFPWKLSCTVKPQLDCFKGEGDSSLCVSYSSRSPCEIGQC